MKIPENLLRPLKMPENPRKFQDIPDYPLKLLKILLNTKGNRSFEGGQTNRQTDGRVFII